MLLTPLDRRSAGSRTPAARYTIGAARWLSMLVVALLALAGPRMAHADTPSAVPNPVKVMIPAIGVTASVQDVGLADDGTMGVPVGFDDVAWYDLGAEPGQAGYAAFTGHISSTDAPGVFYNIDNLGPGNTIHVVGDDGTELVFIVQEVDTYKSDSFPLDKIFAPTDQPGVVLITCSGDWDPTAHLFADRIVVYATLATS
jgi:sortase A